MPYSMNLVCIVKNAEQTLERLIASVASVVDKCIVVDTGSTDNTVALAQSLGCTVHHFQWCDDFSAARNFALDQSDSDWNLVLDADEWVRAGHAELLQLKAVEPHKPASLKICSQYNQMDTLAEGVTEIVRVLPRAIRYTGIVHEQPHYSGAEWRLNCEVGHEGYLDKHQAAKRGRNLLLLQKALKADPSNWYYWYQLGKQAVVDQHPELAVCAFERSFGLFESLTREAENHPYLVTLVCNWVTSLKQTKNHELAMNLAHRFEPLFEGIPDLDFCLADVLMDWAADAPLEQAFLLLSSAQQSLYRCIEKGDCPDCSQSIAGRGSHLAQHNLQLVDQVLQSFRLLPTEPATASS